MKRNISRDEDSYRTLEQLNNYFCTEQFDKRDEKTYKELQENIIRYKEGNVEALEYIIKSFHIFITKYARLICLGHLPKYECENKKTGYKYLSIDKNIASFVNLYISKEMKEEFNKDKNKCFSAACLMIKNLFSKYEYIDIYNELVLALLNMANRYKITKEGDLYHKENGTFHMYVQKCFHWEAKRTLDKLIDEKYINPVDFDFILEDENSNLVENFFIDKSYEKQILEIEEKISREYQIKNSNKLTLKESEDVDIYNIDILNFNWTNGVTCSEPFKNLTSFEREILILFYIKKQDLVQIGKIYGFNKVTIGKYKRLAIQKLKEEMEKCQE